MENRLALAKLKAKVEWHRYFFPDMCIFISKVTINDNEIHQAGHLTKTQTNNKN